MDIAAISTIMKQSQVQQAASVSVMRMAMNTAASNGEMFNQLADSTTKLLEQSVQPHLGANLDIRA